jgi:hypothetical protein
MKVWTKIGIFCEWKVGPLMLEKNCVKIDDWNYKGNFGIGRFFCSFLVELGFQLCLTKWFIVQAKILIPTIQHVSMWRWLFFCHFPLGRSNFLKRYPHKEIFKAAPKFHLQGPRMWLWKNKHRIIELSVK